MVCSLFNWSHLRSTFTRRVRIGVGTKANFAPCNHHRDPNGCFATIHSATGSGIRNRFFENSKAGLQLRQKSDHTHRLWTWFILCGRRGGPLRMNSDSPKTLGIYQCLLDCQPSGSWPETAFADVAAPVLPIRLRDGFYVLHGASKPHCLCWPCAGWADSRAREIT